MKSFLFKFIFIVRIVIIAAMTYCAAISGKLLYWVLVTLLVFFAIIDVRKHINEKKGSSR
ncbi:hypothetical protein C1N61_32280 (plasmid) [Priestia aryabhattai]